MNQLLTWVMLIPVAYENRQYKRKSMGKFHTDIREDSLLLFAGIRVGDVLCARQPLDIL